MGGTTDYIRPITIRLFLIYRRKIMNLNEIKTKMLEELNKAENIKELNDLKVSYQGKKGIITELLSIPRVKPFCKESITQSTTTKINYSSKSTKYF